MKRVVLFFMLLVAISVMRGQETNVDSLRTAASAGDFEAMVALAGCYEFGDGVAPDRQLAEQWYLKAAEANYAPGQWSLAWFYYRKDNRRMAHWLQKAADNGWDYAKTDLGICYHDGIGVKRDYKKAAQLFQENAEVDETAAFWLSLCYYKGHGVAKDNKLAISWLEKATPLNHEADYMLAWFCYQGKIVAKDNARAAQLLNAIISDKNALLEAVKKAERLLKKIRKGK